MSSELGAILSVRPQALAAAVTQPQSEPTIDATFAPVSNKAQQIRDWLQNSTWGGLLVAVVGLAGGGAAVAGFLAGQLVGVALVLVGVLFLLSLAIMVTAIRQVREARIQSDELKRALTWRGVPEQRRRQERLLVEDMVDQATLVLAGERLRGIQRPKASVYSGWDFKVLGDLHQAVEAVKFDIDQVKQPPALNSRRMVRSSRARPEVNAPGVAKRMALRRAEVESLEADVQSIAARYREEYAAEAATKQARFESLNKERRADTPVGRARQQAADARAAAAAADAAAEARLLSGLTPTAPPQSPGIQIVVPMDGTQPTSRRAPARPTPEQIANDYPGSVEPPPNVTE